MVKGEGRGGGGGGGGVELRITGRVCNRKGAAETRKRYPDPPPFFPLYFPSLPALPPSLSLPFASPFVLFIVGRVGWIMRSPTSGGMGAGRSLNISRAVPTW